jgi:hypothetical protein
MTPTKYTPGDREAGMVTGPLHVVELPAANPEIWQKAKKRSPVVIVASLEKYNPNRNAPAATAP